MLRSRQQPAAGARSFGLSENGAQASTPRSASLLGKVSSYISSFFLGSSPPKSPADEDASPAPQRLPPADEPAAADSPERHGEAAHASDGAGSDDDGGMELGAFAPCPQSVAPPSRGPRPPQPRPRPESLRPKPLFSA